MRPRFTHISVALVISACLAGCAPTSELSAETVRLEAGGAPVEAVIRSRVSSDSQGVVVLVDGSDEREPGFVTELVLELPDAGYDVVTFPTVSSMTGEQLASVLHEARESLTEDRTISLVAFGGAGAGAWQALAGSRGLVRSAVLVSCPLPDAGIDFSNLAAVGVRGFYVERSASYESSYWKAHLAMRDLYTPHDFLIYGGELGDRYYEDPSPLAGSTWEATIKATIEWLDIWQQSDVPVPVPHHDE